jgi:hypothetical protein
MNAKTKAKGLLKTNKMAQGDSDHARAMRAYWRGVGAGRNVAYLLKQKGSAGKGAMHAKKLLAEDPDVSSASILRGSLTENAGQTIWKQMRQMKLNGFPLTRYLGAKNPSASNDGLTVDLRGKWKGRVIIKHNKGTDLYDLTFGRVRKYEWIVDSKVLGVEVGNLAHVLQRYVEYGEAKKKKTKKAKTISAGVIGEAKAIVAQTWEFKKKGSAEKFYRLLLNLAKREKATWHPESNSTGLRVRVSGESYGSGKITPIDQTTFNKLDALASAHHGRRRKTVHEGVLREDYTAAALDSWWQSSRPKLIKGGKGTRLGRMNGCIKSLRALRDGGIVVPGQSQTQLNPVPKKERDSEDQPVDKTPGIVDESYDYHEALENDMSLNDAIAAFRGLDEANIPAPGVKRSTNGKKQFSPKSRFSPSYHNGPWTEHDRSKATVPTDGEAMAPAINSTAGVKDKQYYGADGRENVDVRVEDLNQDQLARVLGDIAQVSVNPEKFLEMVNQEIGLDKLDENLVAAVGNHVFGRGSIEINDGRETRADLHNKGMGIDDFAEGNDGSDLDFAQGMLDDTLDKRGAYKTEANIQAPKASRTNAGGRQIDPTSKFARDYDPTTAATRKTNTGDGAPMPADREAMAPAINSTAGVSGPGYGADGREEVDVRTESYQEPRVYDEAFFMNQGYTPPSR